MANKTNKCDAVKPGMKFGLLTVLEEDYDAESLSKYSHKIFKCECECGQQKSVDVYHLLSGHVKSCGASVHRRAFSQGTHTKDLSGMMFENMEVIEKDASKITKGGKHVYWICKCTICGKTKSVRSSDLISGKVTDCGCGRSRRISDGVAENLSGLVFGHLTVIEKDISKIKSGSPAFWICKCDLCGRTESVAAPMLKYYGKDRCKICMGISNGEQKIIEMLESYNISFVHDKPYGNFKYSISGGTPRFDFRITSNSDCDYIIEFDGEQHYKEVTFGPNMEKWQSLEYVKIRDDEKNSYCASHNIPLIRIPYKKLKTLDIIDLLPETSDYLIRSNQSAFQNDSVCTDGCKKYYILLLKPYQKHDYKLSS